MTNRVLSSLSAMAESTSPALAEPFRPAVIFDTGGKTDRSFNQAVYEGAERLAYS